MNIQYLPRSPADDKCRALAGISDLVPEELSPGGPATQVHDLLFHGGKTIANLTFTNFYIGGDAWDPSDIRNIDQALAAAMSEPTLNNMLAQYFSQVPTSRFAGSQNLHGPAPAQMSKGDVEQLISNLEAQGQLAGFDLTCTVFNFMLPRGTVLSGNPESEANGIDSLNGLGGYHGSVQVAGATVYYTVGVYSETVDGKTNGIPVFDAPWKNVVATAYHQLNEVRTDPDIQPVIDGGSSSLLGWTSPQGEECGDFPVFVANPLSQVFQEVPVAGGGTTPVQFLYSNYAHGPEGPVSEPRPSIINQLIAFNTQDPSAAVDGGGNSGRIFSLCKGPRIAGDFRIDPVGGYIPTPAEQECLDRINQYVTELVAISDDGTPRGKELVAERDACLVRLQECAQEFVAAKMTATNLLLTTYKYQGSFEERIAHLDNSTFVVRAEPDPHKSQLLLDVHYDIGPGKTTKDQLKLKRDIDKAVTVVKVVMADSPSRKFASASAKATENQIKRNEYIQQLVGIGRVGLTDGNIDLAKVALETLKDEFVAREAARVKNHYVRRLGIWATVFIVLFATAYLMIANDWGNRPQTDLSTSGLYRLRNFFPLAIGASFGAWLAFLIRRPILGFADLVQLDDDLLNPVTRVVFTIVLGVVIGLLFWTGMVAVKIGSFSTDFENNGATAIVIGAFCGIASRALATAVSGRAEEFAGNVGGTTGSIAGGKGL